MQVAALQGDDSPGALGEADRHGELVCASAQTMLFGYRKCRFPLARYRRTCFTPTGDPPRGTAMLFARRKRGDWATLSMGHN
jgi:hypothetical protein